MLLAADAYFAYRGIRAGDGGLIRQAGSNINVIYRAVVTPTGKVK